MQFGVDSACKIAFGKAMGRTTSFLPKYMLWSKTGVRVAVDIFAVPHCI